MGVRQARNLEKEDSNKERTGPEAPQQRLLASLEVTVEEREDFLVSLSFISLSLLLLEFTRLSGNVDVLSAFPGHASTDKGSPTRG